MEEFTLLPKDAVWDQVEARIKKERNRKPLFIWMLAGLLLLGGAGAWWYISNESTTSMATSTGGTVTEKDVEAPNSTTNILKQKQEPAAAPHSKAEDIAGENTSNNSGDNTGNNVGGNTGNKVDVLAAGKSEKITSFRKKKTGATVLQSGSDHVKTNAAVNSSQQPTSLKQVNETGNKTAGVDRAGDLTSDENLPLHKHYKTPEDLMRDSMQRALSIKRKANNNMDTSSIVNEKKTLNKVSSPKQWKTGFTLYGGLSDNVGGLSVFGAKSLAAYDYRQNVSNSNSGTGVTSPPSSLPPLQHKAAGSFGVGAFAKRQLSKRIDITVGLDYRYFSTNSPVGTRRNTSLVVYDSLLMTQSRISSYYGGGDTVSIVNKYHLLQLPLDFGFRLNKNAGRPIVISLGVTPALIIGSDALYLNRGSNLYYSDKHQFKKFMLFGQSALMFTAVSTRSFSVSAGPAFQYGLNSFSKRQTGTNQHLLFTGIKTNIIFK